MKLGGDCAADGLCTQGIEKGTRGFYGDKLNIGLGKALFEFNVCLWAIEWESTMGRCPLTQFFFFCAWQLVAVFFLKGRNLVINSLGWRKVVFKSSDF